VWQIIARRFIWMVATLLVVSLVAFLLVQFAPGDYAETYATRKTTSGTIVSQSEIDLLRMQLGLDQPWYVQYWRWLSNFVTGDWGMSWEWRRPVIEVIGERLPTTLIIAFGTLVFMYAMALPIGIYSAVRQYSATDLFFSLIGYVGLAIPSFLLALVLMYIAQAFFGQSVGGLYTPGMEDEPWSMARFVDLLAHLWIPVVVLGTSSTAYLIRSTRAAVLDELQRMYVVAARAGGLAPLRLLLRYPVRVALNPIAATIGWRLTYVISGAPIVGVVMALPDTGPLFLNALLNQDMQLASALIFIFSALTILGTFISDVLLAILDPRVRVE
jgi:peptide/nickel transport system permease protein